MKKSSRTGSSFAEMIVAIVVVTVMLTVATQLLTLVLSRMAVVQRHRTATATASNVLERITSQHYSDISAESIRQAAIQDAITRSLPGWTAELNIVTQQQPLPAKRIELILRSPQPEAHHASLVTWKYAGRIRDD